MPECRFCKQDIGEQYGSYYFGNFVCNNCVDIIELALSSKNSIMEK